MEEESDERSSSSSVIEDRGTSCTSEETSSFSDRSHADHRSGYCSEARGEKRVFPFEPDESPSPKHRAKKLHVYESSLLPSTSGYKSSRNKDKARFESKQKFIDKSTGHSSYKIEKARDYDALHKRCKAERLSDYKAFEEINLSSDSSDSQDREAKCISSIKSDEFQIPVNRDTNFEIKEQNPVDLFREIAHKIERAHEYNKSHKLCEKPCDYRKSSKHSKHPIKKPHYYDTTSVPSTSKHKDNIEEEFISEDLGKKISQTLFSKRPGYGNQGRSIKVVSNCYPIEFPTGYVYHYDIEIVQNNLHKVSSNSEHKKYRCLNTKRNREVVSFMLDCNPEFKRFYGAFDGRKNLITKEKLKFNLPFTCTVKLPSENIQHNSTQVQTYDNFNVKILSLVSKINLDSIKAFYQNKISDLPQEAIMALEIMLRHSPCLKLTPIGRSFFYPPNVSNLTPFGGGLDIWFGYHQSIRLGQWKPTVNLNVTATTFWKAGPVLNYIADHMNVPLFELGKMRHLRRSDIRRFNQKLKQRQVKVTHLPYKRKYRVIRMRDISADQEYIEYTLKNNKVRRTVAEYFKDIYGMDLKYGNLPCLQVQPEQRNVFIPIEICEFIEGQHYKGELTQAQKSQMIESTSEAPHKRFKKIQDILNAADFNRDKVVKGFELEISNKPVVANARVLNSPNLVYKNSHSSVKTVVPSDGVWNMRNSQFYQGAVISRWVLLSFFKDRNLGLFADLLDKTGKNLGMKLGKLTDIIVLKDTNCNMEKLFKDLKARKNELAVIVLPKMEDREEKGLYAEIKKVAETEVGLPTQCIKGERLRDINGRRGSHILSNLCLKINAKLGGENYSLHIRDIPPFLCKPVIIIGADVNHPSLMQSNQPSIAACVGSLDCVGKRFAVSIRAQVHSKEQKKKVEEILALEDMIYDLLLAFYKHTNGQKPEKILFYRDGVSEGELLTVKNKEILSIRIACLRLNEDYQPGITVIVVQKRHHVRFRPMDQEDSAGRNGNIPPGTVIDTDVTHPVNFDFFLCSQFGIQGTSRPSHYLVVEDDNNFTPDELQKLTYQLCHMYVRCTRSISIPAPVAYADLVAYRARIHLESKKEYSRYSSDCSRSYRLTQDDINAIEIVNELKNSMYFV